LKKAQSATDRAISPIHSSACIHHYLRTMGNCIKCSQCGCSAMVERKLPNLQTRIRVTLHNNGFRTSTLHNSECKKRHYSAKLDGRKWTTVFRAFVLARIAFKLIWIRMIKFKKKKPRSFIFWAKPRLSR